MGSFTLSNNYLYTTGNTTNVATSVTISPYGAYPNLALAYQYQENAVIPQTPEAWLRQRVREVCELAA